MDLKYIAAPMVNQSDLPFRLLARRYGATTTYTQMYLPEKLLHDQDYQEYHIRDLTLGSQSDLHQPVVAQLCGDDPETIVQAGRKIQGYCDAIDLNLGCPQEAAREGHFGAYLLAQKDWQLVENIVSAMSRSFIIPVSAKLRLCQPAPKTVDLASRLEAAGASWITLHARTVSAKRRRQGAADLAQVKLLKDSLRVPVISNGNVRRYSDLAENLRFTGADGVMVGETLLGNPCLFAGANTPDPVDISLEYLSLCEEFPGTALITIQTHVRHFVEFQCGRRPWFPKFRTALAATDSLEAMQRLLRFKVERWRGRPPRTMDSTVSDDEGSSLEQGDHDNHEEEGRANGDEFGFAFN